MKRCLWLAMLALLVSLTFSNANAQEDPLSKAGTLLKEGKAKAALRQLRPLLNKAMALQVQALSKSGKSMQALKVYETLTRLQQKEQFGLLKDLSWSLLTKLLKGKDQKSLQFAADFLGAYGDKKAVPLLLPLLSNKNAFLTRLHVADALGMLGDKSAIKGLKKLVKERSSLLKTSAAFNLAKLGEKSGRKQLKTCFKKQRRTRKLRCAQLLARLGDKSVRRYLTKELKTNRSPRAREIVAKALSALRNKGWVHTVQKDLKSGNTNTRLIAIRTLGLLKARRARRALRKSLKDNVYRVRIAAARALGQLNNKGGSALLQKALKDSNSEIRAAAALALADVRDRKAKSALLKALNDKHLLVRVNAAFALVRIGSQEGVVALREAFARGNAPLQTKAIEFALLAAKAKRLKGKAGERQIGTIAPAKVVNAFVDRDPDDGTDDDDKPAARAAGKSGKGSKGTKATKGRKAPPARRKSGDIDDEL